MTFRSTVLAALLLGAGLCRATAQSSIPDTPFWQDYHEGHPLSTPAENDVRSVAVAPSGLVYAATADGVRVLVDGVWQTPVGGQEIGAAYCLYFDSHQTLWIGAWNGLYKLEGGKVVPGGVPDTLIGAISSWTDSSGHETLFAAGPFGLWRSGSNGWEKLPGRWQTAVHAILPVSRDRIWIGCASGLYRLDVSGDHATSIRYSRPEVLLSSNINGLTRTPSGDICVSSTGGMDFYHDTHRVSSLAVRDGLPNRNVRWTVADPAGRLWSATALGVVRREGNAWSLRNSRRWLQNDDARFVAAAPDGTIWVATGGGVDAIKRRKMTLEEKAAYFLEKVRARHIRPPGLIGPAVLVKQGDLSASFIEDDDNDGEHTGMYCAMESFRYAVTHDPAARENAKVAFHALTELQRITGTDNFIARSMLPIETPPRHEVERTFTPEQIAETARTDPREKIIEQRWVLSADGKWRWKRDASSDEVDGHMFGYSTYYDLCADDSEKPLVAAEVSRLIGGIVNHGFNLVDIDGKPTRWGHWAPESLNDDPNWFEEKSGNSTEIIAFLGVAYHQTHDPKYLEAGRTLVEKYGYGHNMADAHFDTPSERTHIEDELLTMVYAMLSEHLIMPGLKPDALASIRNWHLTCEPDGIPFYDFVYNRYSGKRVPLARAVEQLRDWPLDMIEWTVDTSRREDVKIDTTPGLDPGFLTRMVPRSEMGLCTWDQEPYKTSIGNDGAREEKGVDWLLAYWMGRYYGLVSGPDATGGTK